MEAKKSLGQNFLRDEKVVEKIILSISPQENEIIVEVGPGEGVLTEALAKSGAQVIAIELDDRLIPVLEEKFKDFPNVRIVHQNVLNVDIFSLLTTHYPLLTSYRVVGNLPYYITSAIIRKFLENEHAPTQMFFMTQKEVAERICAMPGKMSILAVAVQYYADPELLFIVPKEAFTPVPKVESAFIHLLNKKRGGKHTIDRDTTREFFRIVKIGFSARRKTLVNNLSNGIYLEKKEAIHLLKSLGIEEKARAQDLSTAKWKNLLESLQKFKSNNNSVKSHKKKENKGEIA